MEASSLFEFVRRSVAFADSTARKIPLSLGDNITCPALLITHSKPPFDSEDWIASFIEFRNRSDPTTATSSPFA